VSRSRRFLAGLLAVLALGGCGDDDAGDAVTPRGFSSTLLRVLPAGLEWCVWLADDASTRRRGLMEVTELGDDRAGMLFAFDGATTGTFWMRNTPMPLTIGFFAEDGSLVSTTEMRPCGDRDDCPSYAAAGPYRWALEVQRGGLDELGVLEPGARIDVAPGRPCPTPQPD
jgi:uncharacterized membrane protein (UPF0127 family)